MEEVRGSNPLSSTNGNYAHLTCSQSRVHLVAFVPKTIKYSLTMVAFDPDLDDVTLSNIATKKDHRTETTIYAFCYR